MEVYRITPHRTLLTYNDLPKLLEVLPKFRWRNIFLQVANKQSPCCLRMKLVQFRFIRPKKVKQTKHIYKYMITNVDKITHNSDFKKKILLQNNRNGNMLRK